jgi:hypothetical protein
VQRYSEVDQQLSHLPTTSDLTTTSSPSPDITLLSIKTMDQYFNALHQRATMVRRIWHYMCCGRQAHEVATLCPMSDNHRFPWSSGYVLATYLVAPRASWHHHLRSRNRIRKLLVATALY